MTSRKLLSIVLECALQFFYLASVNFGARSFVDPCSLALLGDSLVVNCTNTLIIEGRFRFLMELSNIFKSETAVALL